jgi:hypothetical protein
VVFETLGCDGGGPVTPVSARGHSVYYLFVDAASGKAFVDFTPSLSTPCMLESLDSVITKIGRAPKTLHSDSGLDFTSTEATTGFRKRKINWIPSPPYMHSDNGLAERMQRTLFDSVRTTLADYHVPEEYWCYCLEYTCYVRTFVPSSARGWRSPYQIIHGAIPDTSRVHPFGCKVTITLPGDKLSKLDPRAVFGVFLGINPRMTSYSFLVGYYYKDGVRDGLQVITSTDVVFHDDVPFFDPSSLAETSLVAITDITDDSDTTNVCDLNTALALFASSVLSLPVDPVNHRDAMSRPPLEVAAWLTAEDDEWTNNILANAVITVDRAFVPSGTKLLPTHFVYKVKPPVPSLNKPLQYKTRLVVAGNRQGVADIGITYAPTAPISALRLLLAIYQSTIFRSDNPSAVVRHGDVTGAFTLAKLPADKHIYILPPSSRYSVPNKVYKLVSALYGLREAPKYWSDKFTKLLISAAKFTQSQTWQLYP